MSLRLTRNLLVVHLLVLVVLRLLHDADDFVNWDLTGFLNANSFGSLWELLNRPEVHFRNPFSFPLYNVGAESVISTVMFRMLGKVSLYWASVVVVLFYDVVFIALLHALFQALFHDLTGEALAWLLLAMSPVVLTFMSTSAFNVQAYCVVVAGLLGAEYLLQRRLVLGTILLAAGFCMISQAYPLAFYLPYFLVVWVAFRTVARQPGIGTTPGWKRGVAAAGTLALVGMLALLVNYASHRTYFPKIAPNDPYGGSEGTAASRLAGSGMLFLRQSFVPLYRPDGVPVGFAPYFLYVVLIVVGLWAIVARRRRSGVAVPRVSLVRSTIIAVFAAGLVVFGYVPAFISVIVKSQRALFGDLFLVIVMVFWLVHLGERRLIPQRRQWILLLVLLTVSDAYYVYFTRSVDHSRNHYPRFDFDLSDGIVRHDFEAAIETMKREVENENATLIIYYPRGYSENTTDPGMFFARFLRHFGRYQNRPELMFPCRWCGVKGCPACGVSYGCPFPEVFAQPCSGQCCYRDPLKELSARNGFPGKKLFLWWYGTAADVEEFTLDSVLQRFGELYRVRSVEVPPVATSWHSYELLPLATADLPGSPPSSAP